MRRPVRSSPTRGVSGWARAISSTIGSSSRRASSSSGSRSTASRRHRTACSTREVTTDFGDRVKYDVVNLIPPQRAGTIAVQADLVGADKRWCEVDHVTYESVKHKNVHVVGDSTIGLPVPKSGNIANAMGKICAVAVVHLLNGKEVPSMAPGNTCYS